MYRLLSLRQRPARFGDALRPEKKTAAIRRSGLTSHCPNPQAEYLWRYQTSDEDLCRLFHKLNGLPVIILKASRFFPEEDDSLELRNFCSADNAKVNELLFRRADLYEVTTAHIRALEKVQTIGLGTFIISGNSPFHKDDLADLAKDAPAVVESYFPQYTRIYHKLGWKMVPTIDRVYRNWGGSPCTTFAMPWNV